MRNSICHALMLTLKMAVNEPRETLECVAGSDIYAECVTLEEYGLMTLVRERGEVRFFRVTNAGHDALKQCQTPQTQQAMKKQITAADLTITIVATAEDRQEAFSQLGECMTKQQINKLLAKAETNEWHWCWVLVTAEYMDDKGREYTAEDSLGGCSYKSRLDFINNSGYYEDMVSGLVDDINRQLTK